MKGQNSYPGFTLFETLVVMMIILSFVFLPTLSLRSWYSQLEKAFFYYRFEKSILHLQQVAIADHRNTRIDLYPDRNLIIFYTNHTTLSWRELNIPESIRLVSQGSVLFSAGKGNISTNQAGSGNIPKIVFTDEGQVIYQFQIGSGRFEKK